MRNAKLSTSNIARRSKNSGEEMRSMMQDIFTGGRGGLVKGMRLSAHAEQMSRKGGITQSDVELIVGFGKRQRCRDGGVSYSMNNDSWRKLRSCGIKPRGTLNFYVVMDPISRIAITVAPRKRRARR